MAQYIDKDRIVTEIERQIELLKPFLGACAAQIAAEANAKLSVFEWLKNFLDTLKVEEVDIERRRGMTYNELAEVFKRDGGDAQVCFSVINQNQILFGNNETKIDIISLKNEEPISE